MLRLRDGEAVTVTDGAGRWRSAASPATASNREDDIVVEPPDVEPLTISVAMPKGDRADWLVQKCTEVGVDRIVAARSLSGRWRGGVGTGRLVR